MTDHVVVVLQLINATIEYLPRAPNGANSNPSSEYNAHSVFRLLVLSIPLGSPLNL